MRIYSFLVLLVAIVPVRSQDLKAFEKRVTEFTLPNGLHFIVTERHEAPVVSFHTYVGVGSVEDPSAHTGLAHMFEHLAFKGTETVGTKDWAAEKKALDAVEDLADQIEAEKNLGPKSEPGKIEMLQLRFRGAVEAAQAFVVPNETERALQQNGGTGIGAATAHDSTAIRCSLPSNRLELWFLLQSQWLQHPVFREFYKERDAVAEEERLQVEYSPQGKLIQQFLAGAFEAHPYRNPTLGWPGDLANLRVRDARAFLDKYYVPGNTTIAIVGDVDPAEARRLADRYFASWPARALSPATITEEPPQAGDRTIVADMPSQAMVAVGYRRPDQYAKDDAALDIVQLILGGGRTGLLYQDLIQERKLALNAVVVSNFPGSRYPSDFTFVLVPALNHTVDENLKALDALLIKFASSQVGAETLAGAKAKARMSVVRRLADNAGLADLLATYSANFGDWRKLFTSIDDLNQVTAVDVQRAATRYLIGRPRTVAYIHPQPSALVRPGGRP